MDLATYILERKGLIEDRALLENALAIARGEEPSTDPERVVLVLEQRRADAEAAEKAADPPVTGGPPGGEPPAA